MGPTLFVMSEVYDRIWLFLVLLVMVWFSLVPACLVILQVFRLYALLGCVSVLITVNCKPYMCFFGLLSRLIYFGVL